MPKPIIQYGKNLVNELNYKIWKTCFQCRDVLK